MCGRRYFVVFMVFLGLLITIGSREVFTMVTQHVIDSRDTDDGNIFKLKCLNVSSSTSSVLHRPWPHKDIMLFQMVYFIGTFITTVPGGILATRFPPRRVSGGCIMATSILFIVMRFDIKYYSKDWAVFVIRFIQGFIEGPIVPALNGVIASWAPKSEKAKLLTIGYAGAYLSSAVSAVGTGLMICRISWGSALLLYGGAGIVWAVLWLLFVHDTPAKCPNLSPKERDLFHLDGTKIQAGSNAVFKSIPWRRILCSVPLSAIVVAAFCRNWIFSLLITQIPPYFKDAFSMDAANIGFYTALPHVLMSVVVISGGNIVDHLLRKQWITTTIARKGAETLGFGVEACCLLALGFVTEWSAAVPLLIIGVGFSGFAISGYQVNPLDLAPQFASVLTAISRLGSIGSVISTFIPAMIEDNNLAKWHTVFRIAGSIHLAGVLYYLIFASGELQDWAVPSVSRTLPDVLTEPTEADPLMRNRNVHFNDVDEVNVQERSIHESVFEKWLTKSMHVKRISDDESDEDEIHSWYQNTI